MHDVTDVPLWNKNLIKTKCGERKGKKQISPRKARKKIGEEGGSPREGGWTENQRAWPTIQGERVQ